MRYIFVDNVRGFAMLVIISWHVFGVPSPWTDTWAMPIFFVIMGLFYKPSDFQSLCQKKYYSLVIPLLTFSIPDFFIGMFSDWKVTLKQLINPYDTIHAGSWFVLCTLWIYIISHVLYKVKDNMIRRFLSLIIVAIAILLSKTELFGHRIILPLYLSSAMAMYIFFLIGELFQQNIFSSSKKLCLLIGLFGLFLSAVDILFLGGVKPFDIMWLNWNQDFALLVTRCSIGCATILAFCKLLPKIPIIAFMGRYSLIVLLSHFYFISLMNYWSNNNYLVFIGTTSLTLFFTFISIYLFPKWVGVTKR